MYSVILLSGGVGKRMQRSIPKQYLLLGGKPIIIHSLERLDRIEQIDEIVIVCADEYVEHLKLMTYQYNITKNIVFAPSGDTRQQSVYNGLQLCSSDNVIIHEAARPFATTADFQRLIGESVENAMLGCDIPFTVLQGSDKVTGLLERSELINVQLPQKFNKALLLEAHNKAIAEDKLFTEDASLLYYYTHCEIKVVEGSANNIKITTPIDVVVGEMVYKEYINKRK